ncbi:MAG: formylglycine-generating enzyme family protein [Acidobacteriota bacterium]|jgi:formylglycine-generating enzyme required for sulfatase activity|nr:formylglycine-generating enzyme family protein [Acidobacteriota bacterium]
MIAIMVIAVPLSSCVHKQVTVKLRDDLGIELVFVKGGIFHMGCTPEQGNYCEDDEKPMHQVTLSDFYIGKYEVTQAQWNAVMNENPSFRNRGGNLPVELVDWHEVQEFIQRLNAEITMMVCRLPTEAEWEYAARGGRRTRKYKYSGSNDRIEVAWLSIEYLEDTDIVVSNDHTQGEHPVGTKRGNELGIYDMSGNVREWVADWYGAYSHEAQVNPLVVVDERFETHVIRGGSYRVDAARVSEREYETADYPSEDRGFRLVCTSK